MLEDCSYWVLSSWQTTFCVLVFIVAAFTLILRWQIHEFNKDKPNEFNRRIK